MVHEHVQQVRKPERDIIREARTESRSKTSPQQAFRPDLLADLLTKPSRLAGLPCLHPLILSSPQPRPLCPGNLPPYHRARMEDGLHASRQLPCGV